MTEIGHDVVLLIDGFDELLTAMRLNMNHVKGVDGSHYDLLAARALQSVFASAKNIENGGSLSVYADTRAAESPLSRIANWWFTVVPETAGAGIYPAVDVLKTGAQYSSELQPATVHAAVKKLRLKAITVADKAAYSAQLVGVLEAAGSTEIALAKLLQEQG